jgi:hypothetical protein
MVGRHVGEELLFVRGKFAGLGVLRRFYDDHEPHTRLSLLLSGPEDSSRRSLVEPAGRKSTGRHARRDGTTFGTDTGDWGPTVMEIYLDTDAVELIGLAWAGLLAAAIGLGYLVRPTK